MAARPRVSARGGSSRPVTSSLSVLGDAADRFTGPDARRVLRSSASAMLSPPRAHAPSRGRRPITGASRPATGASRPVTGASRPRTGASVASHSSTSSRRTGQTYYSCRTPSSRSVLESSAAASHQRMVLTPSLVPVDADGNPLPSKTHEDLARRDTARLMRVSSASSVGSEYVVQLVKHLGVAQSQQEETNKKLAKLEETLQGLVSSFTANKLKELQGNDGTHQKERSNRGDAPAQSSRRPQRERRYMHEASPSPSQGRPSWHPEHDGGSSDSGTDGGSPSKRHLTSSRRRRLKALAAKSARGEVPMTYRAAHSYNEAGSGAARASKSLARARRHDGGGKLGVDGSTNSPATHSSRYGRDRRKPPLPSAPVRVGREVYAKPKQAVTGYAAGVAVRDLGRAGEMVVSQPRFIYARERG